jgi:ribosomal RNA-processing protein 36
MKARYEALAKEGGARAVKKAILKKQKKVSQSEKRSRPYKKHKGMEIAAE